MKTCRRRGCDNLTKREYCSRACANKSTARRISRRNKLSAAKTGKPSWNKGLRLSRIHRQHLKENHKGMLGRKHTKAARLKISMSNMGRVGVLLGKHLSEDTRRKIGLANRGRKFTRAAAEKRLKTWQKKVERGEVVARYVSKSEMLWGKVVENIFGIQLHHSKWLEGRCFDYQYKHFLFELDGSYWHRTAKQLKSDRLKEAIAKRNGYTLIRFPLNSTRDVNSVVIGNTKLLQTIFIKEAA